jgi:hypothetical protein
MLAFVENGRKIVLSFMNVDPQELLSRPKIPNFGMCLKFTKF